MCALVIFIDPYQYNVSLQYASQLPLNIHFLYQLFCRRVLLRTMQIKRLFSVLVGFAQLAASEDLPSVDLGYEIHQAIAHNVIHDSTSFLE